MQRPTTTASAASPVGASSAGSVASAGAPDHPGPAARSRADGGAAVVHSRTDRAVKARMTVSRRPPTPVPGQPLCPPAAGP